MAGEYCRAYECGWKLDEFYEVKKLLDKIRICLIPLPYVNGYNEPLENYVKYPFHGHYIQNPQQECFAYEAFRNMMEEDF